MKHGKIEGKRGRGREKTSWLKNLHQWYGISTRSGVIPDSEIGSFTGPSYSSDGFSLMIVKYRLTLGRLRFEFES